MKKVIFAVIAISAIALSSCTTPTREPSEASFLDGTNPAISEGYGPGGRKQTETGSVLVSGIIDGIIIDADMVPVRLCTGQVIWAKFSDDLYRTAVQANQSVAKGDTVKVWMMERQWWVFWRRFEIVSISVTPKQQPAEVRRPARETVPAPVVRRPVRRKLPVVQPPCCCGTVNVFVIGNPDMQGGSTEGISPNAPTDISPIFRTRGFGSGERDSLRD